MGPGESDSDKQILRKLPRDFPDVYNRVLGVPEVLLPILRHVLIGEDNIRTILKIASVNKLWRKVVREIIESNGIPVYELDCDNNVMTDWNEYFVPRNIPLGYLMPVGLLITDAKLLQPDIQHFLNNHSALVVNLKLAILESDLELLQNLEIFELSNLHTLDMRFSTSKRFWRSAEDLIRTIKSAKKAFPRLKELCLSLETDPRTRSAPLSPNWIWSNENPKLEFRLSSETSYSLFDKLLISIISSFSIMTTAEFDWLLTMFARTIRELDITYLEIQNRQWLVNGISIHPFFLSLPICPKIHTFIHQGEDLSPSSSVELVTCLPNCVKVEIRWISPNYANKSIRQITRKMAHLKILEVYLHGQHRHTIAEHIDDWTFAGLYPTPEMPRLERIIIYSRYPEALTRSIINNVPKRLPTLESLEIIQQFFEEDGLYCSQTTTPIFKMFDKFKRNV